MAQRCPNSLCATDLSLRTLMLIQGFFYLILTFCLYNRHLQSNFSDATEDRSVHKGQ